MVKHNNVIPNAHFHKHWQRLVRTNFNQPARKLRRLNTRKDKAAKAFPRPVERLRSIVRCSTNKYNKRQRAGRGFTIEEIKAAGLGCAFARSVGVSIDHRRKNKSVESFQANVQRLKAYKERVVLYPRTANKPKKGLISDATTEGLNALQVQQNSDRVVFGIPEVKLREKTVKITKELKDRKVYRELRQAWANQYYAGAKAKRAAEGGDKQ